jgi:hypothetical protein
MTGKRQINVLLTLVFLFLGYLGAAISYSHLIGFNTTTPFLCPVCPNIDGLGDPIPKFIQRVAVPGTFNALLFMMVGWLLVFMVWRARHHSTED